MTTPTSCVQTNGAWITGWRHTRQPDRNPAIIATAWAAPAGSAETNPPGEPPQVPARMTNRSDLRHCRGQNTDQSPHVRAGVEGVAL